MHPGHPPIPLDEQIASIEQESTLRRRLYPRWVDGGHMPAQEAAYGIACIQAVLGSLRQFRAQHRYGAKGDMVR